MAFSFSKLLKPKNNVSTSEVLDKIDYKGGTKFASDSTNNVYLDIEELGGFPFIKTLIMGDFSTKIKRNGCTLTFNFNDDSLTLDSDNTTIESNQIKNTNAFYTEIDFELNKEDADKIKSGKIENITYNFNGKIHAFNPVK